MNSGITSIVEQLTGTAQIPADAAPRTRVYEPFKPRKREPAPSKKRNGRRLVMDALDLHETRTPADLARIAGVSLWVVYTHLPGLRESGFAVQETVLGHRAAKRYRRAR